MTRVRVIASLVTALLFLTAGSALASPGKGTAQSSPAQPVYLALGDSVAAGVGAGERADGYVGQLTPLLREQLVCAPGGGGGTCSQLSLVDLSVGGATTSTLISGQLPNALALLTDRNGNANPRDDVQVITVTIGGNDVFSPVVGACILGQGPCAQTVQTVLGQYQANLTQILSQLRAAAGPGTTIVTTAYYNPLPGCFLAPHAALGDVVLEGGSLAGLGSLPSGLNDITRAVSAQFGAEVADLLGELGVAELVGGSDCLHPNLAGHTVIAAVFAQTIG